MGQFLINHSEAVATILSVLAAVVAGSIQLKAHRRRHRREYTLSVLSPLLINDNLFSAHIIITDHFIKNKKIIYDEISKQDRDLVLQLLGYYEFLSAAFLRDNIDRTTLLRQRKSSFKNAYEICKLFIDRRRQLLNRPTVYSELEQFVKGYC